MVDGVEEVRAEGVIGGAGVGECCGPARVVEILEEEEGLKEWVRSSESG